MPGSPDVALARLENKLVSTLGQSPRVGARAGLSQSPDPEAMLGPPRIYDIDVYGAWGPMGLSRKPTSTLAGSAQLSVSSMPGVARPDPDMPLRTPAIGPAEVAASCCAVRSARCAR